MKGNQQQQKQKPGNGWKTVKRLWGFLAVYKKQLAGVLLLVVISSALGLLGPFLIGKTIDRYIVTDDGRHFLTLLVSLIFIYLFYSLSVYLQNCWMISISQNTVYSLRSSLFKRLHQLPLVFFDKKQRGELMSRATNDMENISSTLDSAMIQIFSSLLTLAGTIIVMLWLSPLLTLLTLIIVPVMFGGMKWITSRTGRMFKEQQKNIGGLTSLIEETISGQRIVKIFSLEESMIDNLEKQNEKLKQSGYHAQAYSGFIPKLMNLLNNISFAVVAGAGGWLAAKNIISIGTIVIFAEYSRQFTRPLNDLANQFNTLLSAIAGAERVFAILDEPKEAEDESEAVSIEKTEGGVEFRNVSFSYPDSKETLKNISFQAKSGEMVALVGPTGAGKTTVINLLARFYDPDSGEILIDGLNSRNIRRGSLRSRLGFVLQDSYLFETTIRENIRYGRLDATDEEVRRAAELANAAGFISRLPEQYDTVLKEDGSGISHGQKQLIAIARAVLADPDILILDEATSSIDTITELRIQEALQRLMKGRTSFVIAHRLNTIEQADRILVLQNGRIAENGSHRELLEHGGTYYELNQNRNRAFSAAD